MANSRKSTGKDEADATPEDDKSIPEEAGAEETAAELPEVENKELGTTESEPADTGTTEGDDSTGTDQPESEESTEIPVARSPETVSDTAETAPARRRGGFLGTVLGGIIAAAIGFGAAQYMGPDNWPFASGGKPDETAATLAAQDQRISELSDRVQSLSATVSDEASKDPTAALSGKVNDLESALSARIDSLSQQVGGLSDKLTALDTRVTEVEKRPVSQGGDISGAVKAYEKELDAMRSELAAQRARNDDLANKVTDAASNATAQIEAASKHAQEIEARAAMMRIRAALDAGGGFAPALAALGDVEVPPVLADAADQGVPTLADLQKSFAEPARAALAAARRAEAGQGSAGDRIGAFLRTQFGARSLTPREGNDPDAILSRAEAALNAGELKDALDEIATLPEAGQQAMSGWVAKAQKRADALAAADTLASRLAPN